MDLTTDFANECIRKADRMLEELAEIDEIVRKNMHLVHEKCKTCTTWNGLHCTRAVPDGCDYQPRPSEQTSS